MRSEKEIKELRDRLDVLTEIGSEIEINDKDFTFCCDTSDVIGWVLDEISTDDFLSDRYLNIEDLEERIRDIRKEIEKKQKGEDKEIEFFDEDEGEDDEVYEEIRNIVREEINEVEKEKERMTFYDDIREIIREETTPPSDLTSEEKEKLLKMADEMMNLKKEIKTKEKKINEIEARIGKKHEKIEVIKAKYIEAISLAEDKKGKKIYSNDALRRAELRLRLEKDNEYQRILEEIGKLAEETVEGNEKFDLEIKYNNLVNKKEILMGRNFSSDKIF